MQVHTFLPILFTLLDRENLAFEKELKKAEFPLSNLTSIWHYTDYMEK